MTGADINTPLEWSQDLLLFEIIDLVCGSMVSGDLNKGTLTYTQLFSVHIIANDIDLSPF